MHKQIQAFSLIEVAIVIAVMGILMSIVLPRFLQVQNQAKVAVAKAVGHNLQVALESFNLHHGNYPDEALAIDEVFSALIESGELAQFPVNPFTGKAYSSSDTSGKITYSYSADGGYSLVGYGPSNTTEIFRLGN